MILFRHLSDVICLLLGNLWDLSNLLQPKEFRNLHVLHFEKTWSNDTVDDLIVRLNEFVRLR